MRVAGRERPAPEAAVPPVVEPALDAAAPPFLEPALDAAVPPVVEPVVEAAVPSAVEPSLVAAAPASASTTWLRLLMSPFGALLTMVCFFLPWGRFSCMGVMGTRSGAQLGGMLWLVFAGAVPALAAGCALLLRWRWKHARKVILAGSILGLAVLASKCIGLVFGYSTPFGKLRPHRIGIVPDLGGLGTIMGLLLTGAGALLRPGEQGRQGGRRCDGQHGRRSGRQSRRTSGRQHGHPAE